MLARFSIIVAVDANNGIAKSGEMPWNSSADMRFFKEKTTGKGKNVVIMGRKTYETIPEDRRPLENRRNVVISTTMKQEANNNISIYPSLVDALAGIGTSLTTFDEVYVMGGEQVYETAVRDYLYLCDRIYVTKFKTNYGCDQFFPFDKVKNFAQFQDPVSTRDYVRYTYMPNEVHQEYKFLQLFKDIRDKGEAKKDRTGVGTQSLFNYTLDFDISDRVPFITSKKLLYDDAIRETLWMISGCTDAKKLDEQGVKIWNANTSREFLDNRGLRDYPDGDIGAGYGFQWRHWGAEYKGCHMTYEGQGIDQLQQLIDNIKLDPFSRRHIISAWNVSDLDKMALPPCHYNMQFNVSGDNRHLDCKVLLRSSDVAIGLPYNLVGYTVLTYIIAHLTNLKPRKLIMDLGDAHIYNNHGDGVSKMLLRSPRPWPRLKFKNPERLLSLSDFTIDVIQVQEYNSWPFISMKMAV
jgi:thymidylate synthase